MSDIAANCSPGSSGGASGDHPRARRRWPEWLFPGAGCLALLIACVAHGRHSPMWQDEIYSFNLISDPSLSHMLAAMGDQADGVPPLYHCLARIWAWAFSLDELSLRLFSSLAFCAGLALIWRVLRRAFDVWPSAIALSLAAGANNIIRHENHYVRFYGLFFALIALAVLLAVELGACQRPSLGLLAANVLTQGALVLCQPLGGLYGAALLAAVAWDDFQTWRRVRWRVLLSYPLGWLALLLWLRQLLRQADINSPHGWIPAPDGKALLSTLGAGIPFERLILLFAALWMVRALFHRQTAQPPQPPEAASVPETGSTDTQRRLLLIAFALLGMIPLFLWGFSWLNPTRSLFLPRYVIGIVIGWTIILAHLSAILLRSPSVRLDGWAKAALTGFALVNFAALVTEPTTDTHPITGESDLAFGHFDLPIVCLLADDFLPRQHYSPQAARYYYLLDWEAATSPAEYKILDAARRNYPARYRGHILGAREFLDAHPAFLLHGVPRHPFLTRFSLDHYKVTPLQPDHPLPFGRSGVWPLLLVERK